MTYTVVIAAREHEPFLTSCLASVFDQELAPAHVVVVVNGPGVRTSAVLDDLRTAWPDVDFIGHEVASQPAALKRGLEEVHTEFVAFLDADDEWRRDKQMRQVQLLIEDASTHSVTGSTENVREGTAGSSASSPARNGRLFAATTFRTEAFAVFGPPDASAGHFSWLFRWWFHAQRCGIRSAMHDDVVLRRRVHPGMSWVNRHDEGIRELLSELRRLDKATGPES